MLNEKSLESTYKELLELHKRVIKTYLLGINISYVNIRKFFALYDYYINPGNIIHYFHRPIRIFIIALVKNTLHKISDYNHIHPVKKHIKKHKQK